MNRKLKTIDIQGKEYVQVSERIKYFNENYKEGSISTEIKKIDENSVLIKAIVIPDVKENGVRVFTGHAFEKSSGSYINKTSHIENAETSAVGRALGMMGIGIDACVASYEEVSTAINGQDKTDNKDNSELHIAAAKKAQEAIEKAKKDYAKNSKVDNQDSAKSTPTKKEPEKKKALLTDAVCKCGKRLTENVLKHSMDRWKRPVCYECQKEFNKPKEGSSLVQKEDNTKAKPIVKENKTTIDPTRSKAPYRPYYDIAE